MNTDSILYVAQLKAASAAANGNACSRKWAALWLKEIEYQVGLTRRSRETMTRIRFSAPDPEESRSPISSGAPAL